MHNHTQEWEKDWWGTCQNTYGEEEKQLVYAKRMGLQFFHNNKSPYNIDLKGKSVLDIGGGPSSLLLKCVNGEVLAVLDPCNYPQWVGDRYRDSGIEYEKIKGEEATYDTKQPFNEVWIYNVLQHTEDPKKVIDNAKKAGNLIRIFEWIDTPTNIGHPHSLTEKDLNEWLGGEGKTEVLNQTGLYGKCYYGIFPTEHEA